MTNIMYAHYMALTEDFGGVSGYLATQISKLRCRLFGTGAYIATQIQH